MALSWSAVYKLFHPGTPCVQYYHDPGIPYVDTRRDIQSLPVTYRFIAYIASPILKTIDRFLSKKLDYLIPNSQFTADQLREIYKRPIGTVISPGVNFDLFKPAGPKDQYLYTVGRLEYAKNIDLIIRGFHRYIQRNADSPLLLKIIGDGIHKNYLQSLCTSLNISDRVQFLGNRSSIQVADIAGSALLGLFFNPLEPLGIAVIESLASGTPVIGINSGGISEIVKNNHTGILVDSDPAKISEAIDRVLSSDERLARLSINAAKYAREIYSWETAISNLEEVFDRIELGGNPKS